MLKNTVVKFVVGLAFVLALTTGGMVADELGYEVTSQVEAGSCNGSGSGGGGGC
ncbi:MAG: hypothetical protein AAF629_00570 [Chloroflexota bacterium]